MIQQFIEQNFNNIVLGVIIFLAFGIITIWSIVWINLLKE
jgi:hypothetical protein